MNFQQLHECLRLELVRRMAQGSLTGTLLARQTGYQQAHMSNFLNRKRSLSLDSLDRVLSAQELTIEQLLPLDIAATAPGQQDIEAVPIVPNSSVFNEVRVVSSSLTETIPIPAARLHANRARPDPLRSHWQRFVAVRVDEQQAVPMEPLLAPGSIAVLDRHYNSLTPYHARQPTLYAIRVGKSLLLRYISVGENHLILRPSRLDYPVQLLPLAQDSTNSPLPFIARVCMLFSEI